MNSPPSWGSLNVVTLEGASLAVDEGAVEGSVPPQTLFAECFSELAGGRSLPQILTRLILALERAIPETLGSALLVEGTRLRCAAGPSLADGFFRAADGHPIGEGYGSCGTAAHRRQPVVVDDIATDPLWERYRAVAQRYGVGACWSTPLLQASSGAVMGTLALYCTRPRQPTRRELRALLDHAQLATLLVDYDRMRATATDKEQRFRQLMDDLGGMAWEATEQEVRFTCVGKLVEPGLALAPGSLCSDATAWDRLIHPDDRTVTLRRQREALRRGGDYESEHRLLSADGRTVWVRNVVAVQEVDGGERRLRGVMLDISGQREVQRERERLVRHLAEEKSLLRAVLEQLPQPVSIIAPDGEILIANRALAEMMSMRVPTDVRMQEEFKDFAAYFPDGRRYQVEDWPVSRVLRTGEPIRGEEMQYFAADGLRSLLVNVAPIRDDSGGLLAAVSVSEDITERKRNDSFQRLLVEAGAVLAGSREGAVTARNLAALAVKEFAEWAAIITLVDEAGDLKCLALEHRDPAKIANFRTIDHLLTAPGAGFLRVRAVIDSGKAEFLDEPLKEPLRDRGDEVGAVEAELRRLLQSLGTESAITVPLSSPNRILGAVVFGAGKNRTGFRASDLPLAEELARRLAFSLENARLFADAKSAIRHREEFLSIAAHELRTPLASLRLTVQTIEDQLSRPEIDLTFLRTRAKAGERYTARLDRLIRELLDVAVIQLGRLRLAREEMDLVASAESVLGCLRDDRTLRGVDLVLHGQGPILGWWDPARVEQMMTNLVSNAIKYGQRQPVRVFVEASDDEATFQVEDEGMGISTELLARLFQPFERGVLAGHYGGLGLGLHITDQIVRAHGGTISVRSALGQGSTFTVRLPRRMPS